MKIVAIADPYIPEPMLTEGLATLREAGHDVSVLAWEGADTIEKLQQINLDVEQHGPGGVDLPGPLQDAIRGAEVVITQFAPIGADLIGSCPDLKIIGVLRGGTENVDHEAARARGIPIINTPGRNARAVAEFTVGMILAETRNIARTHAKMMEGQWFKDFPNAGQVPELEGKTVGLVGAGNIGQLVMTFLSVFGVTCQYYDPYLDHCEHGTKVEDLDDLVSTSDIVAIHSRLTPENHHLIDARRIGLMKPSAVLINTARSGLVEEEALLDALEAGKIMGAAIDTFDVEPLPADSRWLTLDNVTITSHLAGTTRDAFVKTPIMLSARLLDAIGKDRN